MKQRLTTFGLAALATIATAGWIHEARSTTASAATAPVAVQAPAAVAPAPEYFATPAVMTTGSAAPQFVQVADRDDYYRDRDYNRDSNYNRNYQRDYNYNRNRQLRQRDVYNNGSYSNPYYSPRDYGYYGDNGYYGPTRPAQKSAVIIGGATAAGAGIGAMAGGGKGAAIGAITGAVGGLIYDRATHNKTSGYGWGQ